MTSVVDAPSSTRLAGRGRRGPAMHRKMGFRSWRDRPPAIPPAVAVILPDTIVAQ
ncbi:hypothetical protein [Lentzea sp. NPDC092896]|uniref:hypothetical protein n=1 Tax=Lentzea sp. NPDC092896 TaxID=3364127 RepID=UPI0037FCB70D